MTRVARSGTANDYWN